MTTLAELRELFPEQIATRPSGHYAHIVTLRLTESYPVFRTDEGLNTALVPLGRQDRTPVDRIVMFMRKQTTPERLRGRELLRKYHPETAEACRYNESPCGACPDCIAYGYAIGESGAEKAKVFGDTAYSLSGHATSHTVRTFNAPNEGGVMYDHADGRTSDRINATEYVIPGVLFPSVTTTRDLTFAMFCYVLNNILSTTRYGAITTRTGRVDNQVVALVVADGEVMSNLALTQAVYDELQAAGQWGDDDLIDPLASQEAMNAVLPDLIAGSHVQAQAVITGNGLAALLEEFRTTVSQSFGDLTGVLMDQVADYRERLTAKGK